MDTERARELIVKSDHVVLLLPEEPTFDCLAATEVLTRLLTSAGRHVGFAKSATHSLPRQEIFPTVAAHLPPVKEFIISVNTGEAPVGELRYEKGPETLEVVLTPKTVPVEPKHIAFREGKPQCDLVIACGIQGEEKAAELVGPEWESLRKVPVLNIDVSEENTRYGTVDLVSREKRSLSEIVAELLPLLEREPLDATLPTLLLAGIMSQTEEFRLPGLPPETFLTASELVRKGAKLEEAFSLARKSLPLELLQLVARAQVRSKMDSGLLVLWSCLTREDFAKTGRGARDVTEVLTSLGRTFPQSRAAVLLWEDPRETTGVHASLAGREELLAAIRAKRPALSQSPYLTLASDFPTFRDGESEIAALLREVL